jgi:hypothetical protein
MKVRTVIILAAGALVGLAVWIVVNITPCAPPLEPATTAHALLPSARC